MMLVVAAGGRISGVLKAQLKIGGRLVIPVARINASGTGPGHARFQKMSAAARISRTSASFH